MTAPLQAECAGELESSPLRKALMETMVQSGCSMKALTVLAAQNDPFRRGAPTLRLIG